MLSLKTEPRRFTGALCAHLTKKGVPACGNSLHEANNAPTLAYWAFLASIAALMSIEHALGNFHKLP